MTLLMQLEKCDEPQDLKRQIGEEAQKGIITWWQLKEEVVSRTSD